MDIEDFSLDDLKDELLKVVDELYFRKWSLEDIVKFIKEGERK